MAGLALASIVLGLGPPLGNALADQDSAIVRKLGYAYVQDSNKHLYTEVHYLRKENGRPATETVFYCSPDGAFLAAKSLDYRGSPRAPDFLFAMSDDHYREGVRTEPKGRVAFVRPVGASELQSYPLPEDPELVIDAGLQQVVGANIARFRKGEALTFPFLVASRKEAYNLKMRPVGEAEVLGETTLHLQIEAVNFWVRQFTSPTDFYFHPGQGRVLRYRGLANLRDAEGWNLVVRVDYPQPPTPVEEPQEGWSQDVCPLLEPPT